MTALPRSRPLTREDLDARPDDGHRYELVDGALGVAPAPSERHETVVGEPFLLLRRACPDHLEVLVAPFDRAGRRHRRAARLLVCRPTDLTARDLPTAPVLAVDVAPADLIAC